MIGERLGWLTTQFNDNADKSAIVWQKETFSYRWLLDHLSQWQEQLDSARIVPGTVVSIEGDYSPESIALFLALIDRNAVVVPLTAGVGDQRNEFRSIAQVQVAI